VIGRELVVSMAVDARAWESSVARDAGWARLCDEVLTSVARVRAVFVWPTLRSTVVDDGDLVRIRVRAWTLTPEGT